MSLTIAVDVDGVVADLFPVWIARYNADWQDTLEVSQLTQWDLSQHVKSACGTLIFDYLHQPSLYDAVKPIVGALEGVQALRSLGHRVVFVTTTNRYIGCRKLTWLAEHGFLSLDYFDMSNRDYVETLDKSLIAADVMIDDAPHNLEVFGGKHKILFEQPHNRTELRFKRYLDWATIPQYVKEIAEIEE